MKTSLTCILSIYFPKIFFKETGLGILKWPVGKGGTRSAYITQWPLALTDVHHLWFSRRATVATIHSGSGASGIHLWQSSQLKDFSGCPITMRKRPWGRPKKVPAVRGGESGDGREVGSRQTQTWNTMPNIFLDLSIQNDSMYTSRRKIQAYLIIPVEFMRKTLSSKKILS